MTVSISFHLGDVSESGVPDRTISVPEIEELTPETLQTSLINAGLTPADVKTRMTVILDTDSASSAVKALSFISGATNRWATIVINGQRLIPKKLLSALPKPSDSRPEQPQKFLYLESPKDAFTKTNELHYARRVYVTLPENPAEAVAYFLTVTGLRNRPSGERLPLLADSPIIEEEPSKDETDSTNTTAYRNAGIRFRSSARPEVLLYTVPKSVPSERNVRLAQAASIPIAKTLAALGAKTNDEGDKWHCPRPDRHTNGDQNPSMLIEGNTTRCFRCDGEWVDSLRLTADTKGISPDEAADWLLSNLN